MIKLTFVWGEKQPDWITNASQYARNQLGLYGDSETAWLKENINYRVERNDLTWSIIFDRDADYTLARLKWA